LTAVALLFALYMVKPSPFCLLDELDAPLDESNIGRFTDLLKRFVDESSSSLSRTTNARFRPRRRFMRDDGRTRGIKTVSMRFNQERSDIEPQNIADAVTGTRSSITVGA